MTERIIKLVSNENYLELLNQSAESIHLSVFSSEITQNPGEIWNRWEAIIDEDS